MDQSKGGDQSKQREDPIIAPIGELGRYQIYLCLMVFLSKYPTGTVTLSTIFLTPPEKKFCVEPANVTDACSPDCEKFEYDRSVFKETITTQFNLVCGHASLASLSQTMVMFGIMVGSIIVGGLSDKYGRRKAFIGVCMLNLVTGLVVSASQYFWFFMLFRFLDAVAVGGIMVTSFVIIMEIVGKKYREIMSMLYQLPFNVGHASLAIISYYFRDWRTYNLVYSSVSIIYLIYFFIIPESPRWLFVKGRIEESSQILQDIARRQNKPTENIQANLEAAYKTLQTSTQGSQGTIYDLFRYPYLRRKTLAMAFNWFAVCLSYYGISQYITNLYGNIFINIFIAGVLGIPGTLLCIPMTIFLGRKITLIISNTICGVSLILIPIIASKGSTLQVVLAIGGLFGSSITFPNVYLYGGELFPTIVRNSGVGLCSMLGRFGSMVAPFISQLGTYALWIPATIIGVNSLIAALCTLLLPETRGIPLPETIEEGETFGR